MWFSCVGLWSRFAKCSDVQCNTVDGDWNFIKHPLILVCRKGQFFFLCRNECKKFFEYNWAAGGAVGADPQGRGGEASHEMPFVRLLTLLLIKVAEVSSTAVMIAIYSLISSACKKIMFKNAFN